MQLGVWGHFEPHKFEKTLWLLFIDGVQLPQDYRTTTKR